MANEWIVVGEDMDGIIGYVVIHSLDLKCFRSGSYSGSILRGLSLNKAKMKKIADELNAKNEPPPDNIFRNCYF